MDGVIVEHHVNHAVCGVRRIDQLQKINEVRAFMPLSTQTLYLTGNQIDARQKRQGLVPLVFVIADV